MRRFAVVSLISVLWAGSAMAAGLYTPDLGVKAMGRGGAFVATADDNSALYYNPAGLFQMDGFQINGGLLGHSHSTCFTRAGGDGRYKISPDGYYQMDTAGNLVTDGSYAPAHNDPQFRPIPAASISYGFENPDLTIAFGLYAPLAPWVDYPNQWGANRYRLTRMTMLQGNFALGAGWRLPGKMNWLAIGGTFQIMTIGMQQDFYASADLEATGRNLNPEDAQWDVFTKFEAHQTRPFGNFGIMILPHDMIRIGVSFAPPYEFKGKGSVELSGEMGGRYLSQMEEEFGPLLELLEVDLEGFADPLLIHGTDDDITVTTNQPAVLKAGIAFQPAPWFDIEVNGHFEFWQVAEEILASDIDVPLNHCEGEDCVGLMEELQSRTDPVDPCDETLGLVDCSALGNYRGSDGEGNHAMPQNWKNSAGIRIGGELQPYPGRLGIRFGYAFEATAIPDETINITMIDNDKHLIGLGLSSYFEGFEFHITYAHIIRQSRTVGMDVSEGMMTGLAGTALNQVDAGTYCARDNFLGINVGFNFTEMHRKAKAKKAAARASDTVHF